MSRFSALLTRLKKFQLPYELFMALLAFLSLYFYYFAFQGELNEAELAFANTVEYLALTIFAIDYLVRLLLAKDKRQFFFRNILDLLALIPISTLFRGFRLVRCAILLGRFLKRIRYFGSVSIFIYILIASIVILMTSALIIAPIEEISYGDALWWGLETIATVGYGDVTPETPAGRVIAVVLMFSGIGFLSFLTSTVTTYYVNRHYEQTGIHMHRGIIRHYQKALMEFDRMTLQDIDDMYHALRALKEQELSLNPLPGEVCREQEEKNSSSQQS